MQASYFGLFQKKRGKSPRGYRMFMRSARKCDRVQPLRYLTTASVRECTCSFS